MITMTTSSSMAPLTLNKKKIVVQFFFVFLYYFFLDGCNQNGVNERILKLQDDTRLGSKLQTYFQDRPYSCVLGASKFPGKTKEEELEKNSHVYFRYEVWRSRKRESVLLVWYSQKWCNAYQRRIFFFFLCENGDTLGKGGRKKDKVLGWWWRWYTQTGTLVHATKSFMTLPAFACLFWIYYCLPLCKCVPFPFFIFFSLIFFLSHTSYNNCFFTASSFVHASSQHHFIFLISFCEEEGKRGETSWKGGWYWWWDDATKNGWTFIHQKKIKKTHTYVKTSDSWCFLYLVWIYFIFQKRYYLFFRQTFFSLIFYSQWYIYWIKDKIKNRRNIHTCYAHL